MSVEVLEAGPLTTVQDAGREGWAHLGVPRAGFLDAPSARLANRLVGNAGDAALLETTLGGVVLRARSSLRLAVTGAPAEVHVDGRPRAFGEALSVPAGAVVVVGPALGGVRSYVAFAGGIGGTPVLDSLSADTLAGVGTPVLRDGDVLAVGPAGPPAAGLHAAHPYGAGARPGATGTPGAQLRFVPGPRADWLHDPGALDGATFRVGDRSNRVGLRLEGAPVARRAGELPSEGIVLGAVQLPPSGEPIVFLNDHPTTGGYPVVAVVEPTDLPTCAQLRPGDAVTLRLRR